VDIGWPAGGIGLPGGWERDDGNMGILGRLGKEDGQRPSTGPGNSVDNGQALDDLYFSVHRPRPDYGEQ